MHFYFLAFGIERRLNCDNGSNQAQFQSKRSLISHTPNQHKRPCGPSSLSHSCCSFRSSSTFLVSESSGRDLGPTAKLGRDAAQVLLEGKKPQSLSLSTLVPIAESQIKNRVVRH